MKHRLSRENGFTLLGVIFAGLSFSVLVLYLWQGRELAIRTEAGSAVLSRAVVAGVDHMERLKGRGTYQEETVYSLPEKGLEVVVYGEKFGEDLLRFKVTVFTGNGREVFTLETLSPYREGDSGSEHD